MSNKKELFTLHSRFRDERKRLKLSHAAVAEICGTSRNAVVAWEGGAKIPAEAISALLSVGVDAFYILSGGRIGDPTPALLSEDEAMLIAHYRDIRDEDRKNLRLLASSFFNAGVERGAASTARTSKPYSEAEKKSLTDQNVHHEKIRERAITVMNRKSKKPAK